MPQWLSEGFRSWHESKLFVERLTSISHDALHVIAGTCVWLLIAVILRRPLTSWMPLAGTFAVLAINEMVDLWVEIWPEVAMQAGEAAKDVVTTMALPLLLLAAFRALPRLTAEEASDQGAGPASQDRAD